MRKLFEDPARLFLTAPYAGETSFFEIQDTPNNITKFSKFGIQFPPSKTVSATNKKLFDDAMSGQDVGDTTGTAGNLLIGERFSSVIDSKGDIDWFAFTALATDAYQFVLTPSSELNDMSLQLYDDTGSLVRHGTHRVVNHDDGTKTFFVEPPSSGTFYISVQNSSFIFPGPFDYMLASAIVEDDYSQNTHTPGHLPLNQSINGLINYEGDWDWIRFNASAGQVISFDFDQHLGANVNFDITLSDGGSLSDYIVHTTDENGEAIIEFTAPTTDEFIIVVNGSEGAEYSITSQQLDDDHGDISDATILGFGDTLFGAMNFVGDQDYFQISVEAGEVYRIVYNATVGFTSSLIVNIVDENGNPVESFTRYSNSSDALFGDFIALEDGFYYVQVKTRFSTAEEAYSLSFESFAVSETVFGITDGQWVNAEYVNTDSLYFQYEAEEGETIFALHVNSELTNSQITVLDALGNVVGFPSGDYFDRDSYQGELSHTFESAGTYYIRVNTPNGDGSNVVGTQSQLLVTTQSIIRPADVYATVYGTSEDDIIVADNYTGFQYGYEGDDLIVGSLTNDSFVPGSGADTMYGFDGFDYVYYNGSSSAVTVNLSLGLGSGGDAEGDLYYGVEGVLGSEFDDTFIGNDQLNAFAGALGGDTFTGGGGADIYYLQNPGDVNGDVITDFTDQNDFEHLDFTTYFSRLGINSTWLGNSEFSGVAGQIRYQHIGDDTIIEIDTSGDGVANEAMTLLNFSNDLQITTFNDIYGQNNYVGSDGNDEVFGTIVNDIFYGGNGNDEFTGNGGDDYIYASAGNNSYDLESDGYHTLDFSLGTEGATLFRGLYNIVDVSVSNAGFGAEPNGSFFTHRYFQKIVGSLFGDSLEIGNLESIVNYIDGGAGNDVISGSLRSDTLIGGEGSDSINGGNGSDVIIGGLGNDTMIGGAGADKFVFGLNDGVDRIRDFNVNEDALEINLSPYTTVAQLQDMMVQRNGYVLMTLNEGNSIRIDGPEIANFTADNFILTGIPGDGPGPFRRPNDLPKDIVETSATDPVKKSPVMEVLDVKEAETALETALADSFEMFDSYIPNDFIEIAQDMSYDRPADGIYELA